MTSYPETHNNTIEPRPSFTWTGIPLAVTLGLASLGLDQASKAQALDALSQSERIPILGSLFGLQLAFNPGTVLSLGSGSTWILTVVAIVAVIAIPVAIIRFPSRSTRAGLGLIWGGAAGNLLDRLFAPPGFGIGHVTDFLAYGNLFIGNLADVALLVGAATVVIGAWRREGSRTQRTHDRTAS